MAYTPENNPYIPGDPYSYDLKWIVDELKNAIALYTPLSDDFNELHDYVMNYFATLDLSQEVSDKLDQMYNDGSLRVLIDELFSDYTAGIDTEIAVLAARMDEFAALPDGSTAGNAELVDIRVSEYGRTYNSAGNAVRAQARANSDATAALAATMYTTPVVSPPGYYSLTASSGINPDTGQNYTSDYWARTDFIPISSPKYVTLGLADYEWNVFFFRTNTYASHTNGATQGVNYAGTRPIYANPAGPNDNYMVVSFRTADGSAMNTDTSDPTSDFSKISAALRILDDTSARDIDELKINEQRAASGAYQYKRASTAYDGLFPLTANSGILPDTGYNSTSNIYCRTSFNPVYHDMITLGLADYDWNAHYFTSNTYGSRYESGTFGRWIDGNEPIYIDPADDPNRVNYVLTFRRKDGAAMTTDTGDSASDFYKIRAALRRNRAMYPPKKSILWLGDSITRGATYETGSLAWASVNNRIPNRAAAELNMNIANFGIGNLGWISGYNSSAPTKTNAYGYLKRVGNSEWYDPANIAGGAKFVGRGTWEDFNTIILSFGTNDGAYPLGSLDDLDILAADSGTISLADVLAWPTAAENSGSAYRVIVKAMYQAYRYIRSIAPHMHIIITDPLITKGGSTGAAPTWGYDNTQSGGYTRRQMNELYAAFCERYGLGHISTYDAPIDRTNINNSLPDGVHPNNATYAALGMYFASKIGI